MTQEETEVDSGAPQEANGATTPTAEKESEESGTTTPAASAPKKPLGAKEVIPFEWKLVGHTGGMAVTLFKAVDRQDVEVQYERILKDGYYKDLKILDINAKVPQPKKPKSAKPAAEKKKAEAGGEKKSKRTTKSAAKNTSKAAASKSVKKVKAANKVAKKKTPPKRAAKKK